MSTQHTTARPTIDDVRLLLDDATSLDDIHHVDYDVYWLGTTDTSMSLALMPTDDDHHYIVALHDMYGRISVDMQQGDNPNDAARQYIDQLHGNIGAECSEEEYRAYWGGYGVDNATFWSRLG